MPIHGMMVDDDSVVSVLSGATNMLVIVGDVLSACLLECRA